ncbi:single-stranded DNA-binding protein [Anaerostipes sp. 992a]|nr:single-stranded DNA-binding protein [Anaerostipes sp. 992a]
MTALYKKGEIEMTNQAIVAGEVITEFQFSHEIFGEGFYTLKIQVRRLSDATDEIPLLVSERLVDVTKNYIGRKLEAKGQFRSYNKHESEKNHLILSLFVRELEWIDSYENRKPNYIMLDGYICKEPVYRMTPLGREICDILLAVNRAYGKSDYIPCICWGRNARFAGNLEIGSHIQVLGRIQSRKYQKKVGENQIISRTAYEISVNKLEIREE